MKTQQGFRTEISNYIALRWDTNPGYPQNCFFEAVHDLLKADDGQEDWEPLLGLQSVVIEILKMSDDDNVKKALRGEGVKMLTRLLEFIDEFEEEEPARHFLDKLSYEKYRGCYSQEKLDDAHGSYAKESKILEFRNSLQTH